MNQTPDPETDALDFSAEARTFVVLATGVGFSGWDLGFDLGAFETIDHRRVWAIWILCTVALVASQIFPDVAQTLGRRWRGVLLVPSLWLAMDGFTENWGVLLALSVVSVATLPFAVYVLAKLLAGDFFRLHRKAQIGLVAFAATTFAVGFYVGNGHDRFVTCDDFARVGDFVPPDCRP